MISPQFGCVDLLYRKHVGINPWSFLICPQYAHKESGSQFRLFAWLIFRMISVFKAYAGGRFSDLSKWCPLQTSNMYGLFVDS
jgi:hypothetical protein